MWWFEQVLHALVGFGLAWVVIARAMVWGASFQTACVAGMVASVAVGFVREGRQNWGDKPEVGSAEDMLVDLGAWVFGACFAPLTAL